MNQYIDMRARFLFSPFPDYMFRNKNLSWAAKCCYCRLIHYTRLGTDGRCYPSQKTLSEDMNLSTRQIYSLIQELVNEGFLAIKKATGRDVYDHKHDEYLFVNHPDCLDVFTDQNFSSSQDKNTYPGPDRAMSSAYKEDNKKEDIKSFSKEKESVSKETQDQDKSLFKEQEIDQDQEEFIICKQVKDLIYYWNSKGKPLINHKDKKSWHDFIMLLTQYEDDNQEKILDIPAFLRQNN